VEKPETLWRYLISESARFYVGLEALTEEKLEFTKPLLYLGNLVLLAWVFLAFFAVWFYNQVYGWLFLLFTSAAIFLVLRRLGCRSCYYCKSCTSGFGRLSALFFGNRRLKDPERSYGMTSAVFFYILLCPLPALFLFISVVQAFSILKIFVLVCLLAISAYSAATWHRTNSR